MVFFKVESERIPFQKVGNSVFSIVKKEFKLFDLITNKKPKTITMLPYADKEY